MSKTRVVILFGGRSAEHEISLLSARNVLVALDRNRYEPELISIDKHGRWRREAEAFLLSATGDPRKLKLPENSPEVAVPLYPAQTDLFANDTVVFPVLHGSYGEDGRLQGLLDMAGVAYVGSGALGSAVGMDKDVTKRLLAHANIPVVPWQLIHAAEFHAHPQQVLAALANLSFPVFVKPDNAGSSAGVSRVASMAGLPAALATAFRFDLKVLVEPGIDAREVECAVMGNDQPKASVPGEIVVTHKDGFYSYDAKYIDADGAHPCIPAQLPEHASQTIQGLALRAFKTLDLAWLARVDFFVERNSLDVYLNEVNTMPGFTAISMYPKMWEASGLSQQDLVTQLIELGRDRHVRRSQVETNLIPA